MTVARRYFMATAMLLVACGSSSREVECKTDDDCNLESGGKCVTNEPTGRKWCTFPDSTCPSGERWTDFDVGDGLSGMCVSDPASGPDAGTPDAGQASDTGIPDGMTAEFGVIDVMPADGSTGISQTTEILITFNIAVSAASANTMSVSVQANGADVPGVVSTTGNSVRFVAAAPLDRATTHTVTVTTAVASTTGVALEQEKVWSFETTTGQWTSAATIEATSAVATNVDIACSADGRAVAVWEQGNDIWRAMYTLKDGWSAPARAESQTGIARDPRIATGGGQFVVAWTQETGTRTDVWASRLSTSWTTPALVERNDEGNAALPSVAVNSAGTAVVGWAQFDSSGPNWNSYATVSNANGTWKTQTRIERLSGWSDPPAVAINASGMAIAVFGQDHDGDGVMNVRAARNVNGVWTAGAVNIDNAASAGGAPLVALRDDGTAVVIWGHVRTASDVRIWSAERDPVLGWRNPVVIDDRPGIARDRALAPIGRDIVLASWDKNSDVLSNVYAAGWGATTPIQSGSGNMSRVELQANEEWAAGLWLRGANNDVWAAGFNTTSGWEPAVAIEQLAAKVTSADVCVLGAGNAVLVFTNGDVFASAIE